jgi:NTE family protein
MENKKLNEITHLVFSGGGGRSFAHIAALKKAEEFDLSLEKILGAAGTSSGGLFALLCLLCKTAQEIDEILDNIPTEKFKDYSITNILNFRTSLGFCDGHIIEKWVIKILYNKTGLIDPSFLELQNELGKTLKIIGTNLTQGTHCIFGPEESPNAKIAKALKISTSIPFLYKPHRAENGEILVDGGLLNNYPLNVFDSTSSPDANTVLSKQQTLGFFTRANRRGNSWNPFDKIMPSSNVCEYINRLVETIISHEGARLSKKDQERTVFIDCPPSVGLLSFSITRKQKEQLILAAEAAWNDYFIRKNVQQQKAVIFSKNLLINKNNIQKNFKEDSKKKLMKEQYLRISKL